MKKGGKRVGVCIQFRKSIIRNAFSQQEKKINPGKSCTLCKSSTSGWLLGFSVWRPNEKVESNSKTSSPVKTYWESTETQTVKISRKNAIPLYVFLRDVLEQSRSDACTWLITMTCQKYAHHHDPEMRAERIAKLQNRLWKKSEGRQKWIGSQQISCQAGENKTGKGVAQQETERSRAQAVIIEPLEQKSLFLWLFLHISILCWDLGRKSRLCVCLPFSLFRNSLEYGDSDDINVI